MSHKHTPMPRANSNDEDDPVDRRTITQATPIQIGMVLILLAGFASWIWWAATISSKLDVLVSKQAITENALATVRSDLDSLKAWRVAIDTSGSPSAVKLREELQSLGHRLDLHLQQISGKGPP